ncbi:MAG: hypothetical protein IJM43_11050 [Bacteroidaceae bacterium]|nr:hypothetical protein [Bacteroidaceae bacterium]
MQRTIQSGNRGRNKQSKRLYYDFGTLLRRALKKLEYDNYVMYVTIELKIGKSTLSALLSGKDMRRSYYDLLAGFVIQELHDAGCEAERQSFITRWLELERQHLEHSLML